MRQLVLVFLVCACGQSPTREAPRRAAVQAEAVQVIDGEAPGGDFGASVAGGGDLNGDGFADLIIGAPLDGGGGVSFYAGGTAGFAQMGLPYAGPSTGDALGFSVRSLGDLNGDGFDDALASAPNFDAQRGLVAVFLGSAGGARSNETYYASGDGEYFGFAMDVLGDTDGDGNVDVAFGAPYANSGRGKVLAFLSQGGTLSSSQIGRIDGPASQSMYGAAVAGAGDLNADGLADLLIGAYGDNSATGRVEVVYGGFVTFGMQADVVLRGEATNSFFGIAIDGAGDTNGDGHDDAAVGAYAVNAFDGRAYLWLGSPDGPGDVAAVVLDGTDGAQLGLALSGLGDVDGDGFADLAVAAPGASGGAGRVLVYAGSADGLDPAPTTVLDGEAEADGFGLGLAGPGDLGGDGRADLLVGAPGHNGVGRVYVYAGIDGGSGPVDSEGLSDDSGGSGPAYALTGGRAACVTAPAPGAPLFLALLVLYSRRQPVSSLSHVAVAVQKPSVRATTRRSSSWGLGLATSGLTRVSSSQKASSRPTT